MKQYEVVRSLNRWAQRHGGVITRREALSLGATDRLIGSLVRTGALKRVHRGVFVLAGTPGGHATEVRAALAVFGPAAVASHQSAAWLSGLVDRPPGQVHVTVFDDRQRRLVGVRLHRSRHPVASQVYQGLRCTASTRTLTDLAAVVPLAAVGLALDRALAGGHVRMRDLDRATRAGSRVPGAPALRRCLRERGHLGAPQPSVLESRMARLFLRYRLPVPRVEVVWGHQREYRLDFAYPAIKLAIEVYGYVWHNSAEHLGHDLARQRRLANQGWTVLAYTWRQIVDDPDAVAAEIADMHRRLGAAA